MSKAPWILCPFCSAPIAFPIGQEAGEHCCTNSICPLGAETVRFRIFFTEKSALDSVLALGSGHSPQEVRQLLNVHGEPVDFWGYSFVSGPIERQRLLSGKPLERILPLNFLANWSSGVAHAMQRAFTVFLVDYDEHTGSPVTHPDEGNPFLTPVPTHPLSSESPPPAGYTAPCRLIREHCIQRGQDGGDWDDPCLLCNRKLASRLFAEIRADQSRLPSAVMGTSALDDSLFPSLHHVCWAGFVDMACPIMVTDVIVGVAFTGQLLVEGLGLDTEGTRARDQILSDLDISLADFDSAASEVPHVQLSDAKQDAWLWLRKATVELQEIARARYGQIGTVRTQVLCDGLCTQIRATELKPRTIDSVRRELITPCLQDISCFFSFSRAAAFAPSGGTWSIVASWPQTGRALPLPVPLELLDKLRNPLDNMSARLAVTTLWENVDTQGYYHWVYPDEQSAYLFAGRTFDSGEPRCRLNEISQSLLEGATRRIHKEIAAQLLAHTRFENVRDAMHTLSAPLCAIEGALARFDARAYTEHFHEMQAAQVNYPFLEECISELMTSIHNARRRAGIELRKFQYGVDIEKLLHKHRSRIFLVDEGDFNGTWPRGLWNRIAYCFGMYEWEMSQRGLLFSRRLMMPDARRWAVKIDDNALQLVLENLVDNAVKYSYDATSIGVTLERENQPSGEETCVLRVDNIGHGIHPSELERIWERLYRGVWATTASRTMQGTGLGMYIVGKIVEDYGGSRWITSTPPEGPSRKPGEHYHTTVGISLPVYRERS